MKDKIKTAQDMFKKHIKEQEFPKIDLEYWLNSIKLSIEETPSVDLEKLVDNTVECYIDCNEKEIRKAIDTLVRKKIKEYGYKELKKVDYINNIDTSDIYSEFDDEVDEYWGFGEFETGIDISETIEIAKVELYPIFVKKIKNRYNSIYNTILDVYTGAIDIEDGYRFV